MTEQAYEAGAYEALRVLPSGRLTKLPFVTAAVAKLCQVAGVTASLSFDRATPPSGEGRTLAIAHLRAPRDAHLFAPRFIFVAPTGRTLDMGCYGYAPNDRNGRSYRSAQDVG
jgi:hypothetical protein